MKRWLSISLSTLAIVPIALSLSQPAQAFNLVRRFTSFLDASQEVDFPVNSNTDATGTATLDLLKDDSGDYALKYEVIVTPEIDFTKLKEADATTSIPEQEFKNDDITLFHLHIDGQRGENGELPFPIKELRQNNPDDPFTLVRNIDDDFTIDITPEETVITGFLEQSKGEFVPTDSFLDFDSVVNELLSVRTGDTSLYWNIHSFGDPTGIIRGQVVATPEPTSLITLLTLGVLGVTCIKNKHKSH